MKTQNAQAEIRSLVDSFVDQLTQHIRMAAVESVQNALLDGQAPTRSTAASTGRKPGRKPGPKPKAAKAKKTGKGGRRVRRSPEEMKAAKAEILRYVRSNAGTAMGDLSAALGEDPTTIRAQLNELLEAKALRKEGERRGTRYFAGSGRSSASSGRKTKSKGRGKAAKRKTSKGKTARKGS